MMERSYANPGAVNGRALYGGGYEPDDRSSECYAIFGGSGRCNRGAGHDGAHAFGGIEYSEDATGSLASSARLDAARALLEAHGYTVRKARARRAAPAPEAPARADGAERVTLRGARAQRRHASCAEHWRVPGLADAVCVSAPVDAHGAPVAPEWADTDTVLAFAADIGARIPRARAGYVPAEQSTNVGYRSTLRDV